MSRPRRTVLERELLGPREPRRGGGAMKWVFMSIAWAIVALVGSLWALYYLVTQTKGTTQIWAQIILVFLMMLILFGFSAFVYWLMDWMNERQTARQAQIMRDKDLAMQFTTLSRLAQTQNSLLTGTQRLLTMGGGEGDITIDEGGVLDIEQMAQEEL